MFQLDVRARRCARLHRRVRHGVTVEHPTHQTCKSGCRLVELDRPVFHRNLPGDSGAWNRQEHDGVAARIHGSAQSGKRSPAVHREAA